MPCGAGSLAQCGFFAEPSELTNQGTSTQRMCYTTCSGICMQMSVGQYKDCCLKKGRGEAGGGVVLG